MHGPCAWRSDGRYRDAPFGASGPLDLVAAASQPADGPSTCKVASVKDAIEAGNAPFCCD